MLDVKFGDTNLQKLDVWKGKGGSPILLFIHGGYWKAFDKNMFQFIAERFVEKRRMCSFKQLRSLSICYYE
ncbi:MAG: hypothetical protein ACJ0DD_03040 [Paracoccaceae bacterium]